MFAKLIVLFAAFILTISYPASGGDVNSDQVQSQKKTIRILGIGNSFLANATKYLPELAEEAGHKLVIFRGTPSSCTLAKHYSMALKNEKDPENSSYKPYFYKGKGKMSLKDAILADEWDYVTIQQASHESFNIDSYRPHAKNLCDYIKKYAPKAEVILHQTWAWRRDIPRDGVNEKYGPGGMYKELSKAYYTIGKELALRIIPVGNAFQLAAESPEWKFERDPNFDYENPKYPNLPDEKKSLHVGYFWSEKGASRRTASEMMPKKDTKDGKEFFFTLDGSHANEAGMYLGACVWFEFFYNEDVRKRNFCPPEIDKNDASKLRELAHRIVTEAVVPSAWPMELNK